VHWDPAGIFEKQDGHQPPLGHLLIHPIGSLFTNNASAREQRVQAHMYK